MVEGKLGEDDANTNNTWEKLRSTGKSWKEIIETLGNQFSHMALLRNLKNIAQQSEGLNKEEMELIMNKLVNGVHHGKQFPFRYYTAYQQFQQQGSQPKRHGTYKKSHTIAVNAAIVGEEKTESISPEIVQIVVEGLEKCMKAAIQNFPQLQGRVVSLSDNSGSAWGAFQSEYGSQTVATIGNLSALITAMSATEGGEIGLFGDKLLMFTVDKNKGILEQLEEINKLGKTVGGGTENGIWLWFDNQFKTQHDNKSNNNVDHLFIYSDMQAGHGGLYGINQKEYSEFTVNGNYINVIKLIERFRQTVNPLINIFSVQTAGYDNNIIPEVLNRSAILSGWTGNEVGYAVELINIWNQLAA